MISKHISRYLNPNKVAGGDATREKGGGKVARRVTVNRGAWSRGHLTRNLPFGLCIVSQVNKEDKV